MSLWSMNDGAAVTGTITFTNGDATVTADSDGAFTTELAVGDVIISAGGVKGRIKSITNDDALELTANFAETTETDVSATFTRPPANFDSASPHIDNNVYGVTAAEAEAGYDNVTTIAMATGGTGYASAPTVTVAAPAARVVEQADVDIDAETITITGHNLRTGTKLTYTQDGSGTLMAPLTDGQAVYVIRVDDDTIKLATSLSNATAGTAINITNDGHDTQSFVGDTATGTAVLSDNKLASVTVTAVGSDYQSVPAVTIAAPAEQTFNAESAVNGAIITISSHPFETGDQVTYSDKGGTAIAELTDGGTFFVIKLSANTLSLSATDGGSAITLTDGPSENHGLTGVTATAIADLGMGDSFVGANTSSEVTHVGWVKKTVGTGGRAGRVHYETLVAASSMTGDGEDIHTPDS